MPLSDHRANSGIDGHTILSSDVQHERLAPTQRAPAMAVHAKPVPSVQEPNRVNRREGPSNVSLLIYHPDTQNYFAEIRGQATLIANDDYRLSEVIAKRAHVGASG